MNEKVKSGCWMFVAPFFMLFSLLLLFRRLTAIILAAISIILCFVLNDPAWITLFKVYSIVSCCVFLISFQSAFSGTFLSTDNRVLKKYYAAIRWNMGTELFSFWCCIFSWINFIYAVAAIFRFGSWFWLIGSIVYILIYMWVLGERLNPYLFLQDRANHGDMKAFSDLYEIGHIKEMRRYY